MKAAEASLGVLSTNEGGVAEDEPDHHFDHHVESGFQLATFQGPLCSEPVEGMAYFLESLEVASDETRSETGGIQLPIPCGVRTKTPTYSSTKLCTGLRVAYDRRARYV